jgi:hypothetical protein
MRTLYLKPTNASTYAIYTRQDGGYLGSIGTQPQQLVSYAETHRVQLVKLPTPCGQFLPPSSSKVVQRPQGLNF